MHNFEYLLEKIVNAEFKKDPFEHLLIEDFLSQDHFNKLINLDKINTGNYNSPEEMIAGLQNKGYNPINFPGCISDIPEYLNRLKTNTWPTDRTTEGFGMTLRLGLLEDDILVDFFNFIKSEIFVNTLKEKFNLTSYSTTLDTGLQKYLHKYEITPHPDIREKALTFMLNINPSNLSEEEDIHTHLCSLKEEYEYIVEVWKNNSDINRCWIPWEYCNTQYRTYKNNSIVIFSPSNTSFHGVKLEYNHLKYQRTQLYGNLWYTNLPASRKVHYKDLENLK